MSQDHSCLVQALCDLCKEKTLEEKWLLAPSLRVGFQWLDSVTRAGQPALNVHVKTFRKMVIDLAAPEMASRGLKYISGVGLEVLLEAVFRNLCKKKDGYLTQLESNPGLIKNLSYTIRDLRMAEVQSADIKKNDFEVPEKGEEISELLFMYEQELKRRNLADYPEAISITLGLLKRQNGMLPRNAIAVIPDADIGTFKKAERSLWELILPQNKIMLASDLPGKCSAIGNDLQLLGWVQKPVEAPPCTGADGTVNMFRAAGESNEVREVLRRCLKSGIPFDEVEILYTDTETYAPLLYETAHRLKTEEAGGIPMTFGEGIPAMYSRPARVLRGWLDWLSYDYSQQVLVRMIQDGLLNVDGIDEKRMSYKRLGEILRTVHVGSGYLRYGPMIRRELAELENKIAKLPLEDDEDECNKEERTSRLQALLSKKEGLGLLEALIGELFESSPSPQSGPRLLAAALVLLQKKARRVDRFDEYCLKKLTDSIQELIDSIDEGETTSLDVREWLRTLPLTLYVDATGPRPGCIYATSIHNGGHSCRRHTFIIGLDDRRFPGGGTQDPLILDGERTKISKDLSTGTDRLDNNIENFARLLVRLRGNATFSYCCLNLDDDRKMFPSPLLLSIYRILEKREGDQDDMLVWIGDPASFAPLEPDHAIDITEWWLSRLCAEENPEVLLCSIGEWFDHLGRGLKAREARQSDSFTEYDGYVPDSGLDLDPSHPEARALSASRLETLGKCPMDYFLRYVLGIKPLDEFGFESDKWLRAYQKGDLLHSAFREYMSSITERNQKPDRGRDQKELANLIDRNINMWLEKHPPPNDVIFKAERESIMSAANIFLKMEHDHCLASRPRYFEVSVGLPPEAEGTDLDSPDPVLIKLSDDIAMLAQGMIDRVDEIPDSDGKEYAIWDYKTGNPSKYEKKTAVLPRANNPELPLCRPRKCPACRGPPGGKNCIVRIFLSE